MSETQTQEVDTGAPPEVDPEIEARARRMGWRPKEEFNGRHGTWIDASEFVERGENMLPLLQERNRSLDKQVVNLGNDLTETKTMLGTLLERTRRAEEVGYKRAKAELDAERRAAIAAGDTEAFERADRQMQDLTPPEPAPAAPKPPAAPSMDPVVERWAEQNDWFKTNPEANAIATAIHGVVSGQSPNMSLEEKLAETTRRMKKRMPELFEVEQSDPPVQNSRRSNPPSVSASSTVGGRKADPRSYDALPPTVKDEYARVVKMLDGKGAAYTKEEHARYYWEQFADDGV